MKTRFAGKIVIVTGGGGEIGRATALRLAREGATVVVADCDDDQAEKAVAEIANDGGQAWPWVGTPFRHNGLGLPNRCRRT